MYIFGGTGNPTTGAVTITSGASGTLTIARLQNDLPSIPATASTGWNDCYFCVFGGGTYCLSYSSVPNLNKYMCASTFTSTECALSTEAKTLL